METRIPTIEASFDHAALRTHREARLMALTGVTVTPVNALRIKKGAQSAIRCWDW